jgi:hypothetical protein
MSIRSILAVFVLAMVVGGCANDQGEKTPSGLSSDAQRKNKGEPTQPMPPPPPSIGREGGLHQY